MSWFEHGMPVTDDIMVLAAATLVERLYVDLREGTGGPLHVILDDDNIYDECLSDEYLHDSYDYLWDGRYEKYALAGDDTTVEHRQAIQDTCQGIVYVFRKMNECHRATALAWRRQDCIRASFPKWYDQVRHPDTLTLATELADLYVRWAVEDHNTKPDRYSHAYLLIKHEREKVEYEIYRRAARAKSSGNPTATPGSPQTGG